MTARLVYSGNLRCNLTHDRSGVRIITDAPVDNHGQGSAFSPTDLTCASLAACIMTTVGIAAQTHGWQLDGSEMTVTKIMASDPRRIAEIQIEFHVKSPVPLGDKDRIKIERTAETCPVALSLHPDVKQTLRFVWE